MKTLEIFLTDAIDILDKCEIMPMRGGNPTYEFDELCSGWSNCSSCVNTCKFCVHACMKCTNTSVMK